MALHVHHGPHLGPLIEILAGTLSAPVADPFTADVISVPTAGMRDWLLQQLGLRLGATGHSDGIASNIDMVFPGRFNAAALGRPLDSTSPWDIERLTWTVLELLESDVVDVPGWRSVARTQRHGTYSKARRIADLFDRYAINRPQLLQQWQAGHDGDGTTDDNDAIVPLSEDHVWQPRLWRAARELIGPNPAEQLPELLAAVRTGAVEPQLPARVAVFGVSGVSAGQLDVLRSLGVVRDVHVFLAHPSPVAWSRARQALAGELVLRSSCDATAAVEHPLLRSWGRPAMEASVLVNGIEASVEAVRPPAGAPAPALPLLAQIQADLIGDRSPVGGQGSDATVQIHACHGTVRQLEVLRDALGHLFASDHSLIAPDVVVLCPDLARFAPLVQSVFQRSILPIPVRVTDLSLGTGNPVAVALMSVLDVIGGRCTGPEVLGLCSLEPVRRAFGFDDDDIERIDRWMGDLGVSWGLDSEHRQRWITEDISEGTWASVLDRILLGAAMPAPTPRVGPGEIVPFDDIDSAALITAGRLGDVLDHLGRLRHVAGEAHPIEEWIGALTDVVNSLLATPPADAWQIIQVMETIAEIGRDAAGSNGANSVPLALNDVRAMLGGVLTHQRGRLNLRSGAVTVTAMVPVRNIPARVVCVLGLDEGTLRGSGGDGDDVLAARPCIGERDQRVEGRHLLLDALMSAGDHFILTCDGTDITTNRRLPLPVLVEELLDIVRASRPDDDIVRWHPRQAFDERNFVAGENDGIDEAFSFDPGMLAAAGIRRETHVGALALPLLEPITPATVTTAMLAEAPTRPAKTYLVQRLDVRLPRAVDEVDTDIPLVLDSLESWQLADELLAHHRRGIDDDGLQRWREAKQLSGVLPPRELAKLVVSDVEQDLAVLLDAEPNLRDLLMATGSVAVNLALTPRGAATRTVRLTEVIERIAGDLLVRVVYTRPKNRQKIWIALELAALVLAEPDRDWQALLVTRSDTGRRSHVLRFGPVDRPQREAAARHLLETTLALHLQALREPIPMFDWGSRELFDSANFDEEEFARTDLHDNHTAFVWDEFTVDEILALKPRPASDEVPDVASDLVGGGRAVALARCFWTAFEAFAPGAM